MEKTKNIDLSNRPNLSDDTWIPHCSFWFFGNEESADNDLKQMLKICDD